MKKRLVQAGMLALVLAGCQAAPPATGPVPPGASANGSAAALAIRGTATYLERIRIPPGASLHVELLDTGSNAVVADTTLRDVAGPPIPFSIAVPAPRAANRHVLRATLLGAQGEPWFETAAPVAVSPGSDPIEVRLRRVTGPAEAGPVAYWRCGELGVVSRFDADGSYVHLSFGDRSLTLPIARSASGARYADTRGNEFWTKGASGTLAIAGQPRRDCMQAAQPSS